MYFSYVPSIIFSFFQSSPFSQSSFQTDPNSILFNINQYYSIVSLQVTRRSRTAGSALGRRRAKENDAVPAMARESLAKAADDAAAKDAG